MHEATPASSFPVRRITSRSAATGASVDTRAARKRKAYNKEIRAYRHIIPALGEFDSRGAFQSRPTSIRWDDSD